MLFNSFEFIVFFACVTALYFALPHGLRWLLLLVASCGFYMAFVPVYILILAATIVIDFVAGLRIEDATSSAQKKRWLLASILSVCGILFVFKYFNFFHANVVALAELLGWHYSLPALELILPIGLSFHTFQSLSYVVEVYRGRQKAERHFGIYALYVMYFPQLVAGPIERPQNLLHQFHERKYFDWTRVCDGLGLALWGLCKKVVVADCLSLYVDAAYNNHLKHNGGTLLLATYAFAFQIYCDFSGYSDIARGVSRVYGIELMRNFETPYRSTSVTEFWSRWHISLSTWFRDYLYIPLGGNRVSLTRNYVNLFTVFLVSGFWHGANWTFIIWGALHGTYVVLERLRASWRLHRGKPVRIHTPLQRFFQHALTFHLVTLAWVFFRADHVSTAMEILRRIATQPGVPFLTPFLAQAFLALFILLLVERLDRNRDWLDSVARLHWPQRWSFGLAMLSLIALFGVERGAQFIYFQF